MGVVAVHPVGMRLASWRGACAALLALLPLVTRAHSLSDAALPVFAWQWSSDPWMLGSLGLSAVLYVVGLQRLWRKAGSGHGVAIRHAWAFAGGWLALVGALVSPLDGLGGWLFSAHMVQHELLMIVAAPLLVMGRPLAVWTWGLPLRWRTNVHRLTHASALVLFWGAITAPLSAWSLHALALWLWHVPALFDAALAGRGMHTLQHLSFFLTAVLFWWAVLGKGHKTGQGATLLYLFTTMAHTTALGALLTLAPTPWYAGYVASSVGLGIDPVEDQQLGGLVMWVPGGLVYLIAALILMATMMRRVPASLRPNAI